MQSALPPVGCVVLDTHATSKHQLPPRNEMRQTLLSGLGRGEGTISEATRLVLRDKCHHLPAEQPCTRHSTLRSLSFLTCQSGVWTISYASPLTVQAQWRDVCEAALQAVKHHAVGLFYMLDSHHLTQKAKQTKVFMSKVVMLMAQNQQL